MPGMTEVKRVARPELSIVVDGQTGMRVSIRGSREKSQATGKGVWARLIRESNVLLLATSPVDDENWHTLPAGGRSREKGMCEILIPTGRKLGSIAIRGCTEVGVHIANVVLAGDLGVDCAFEPDRKAYAVTLSRVKIEGKAGAAFHMVNGTLDSTDLVFSGGEDAPRAAKLIGHGTDARLRRSLTAVEPLPLICPGNEGDCYERLFGNFAMMMAPEMT